MPRSLSLLTLALAAQPAPALSQSVPDNLPGKAARIVKFTTTEGSRMSVDVSPDGKTLVFDVLGDIYTIPITGGKAARVVGGGFGWERNPEFSPDGRRILFVSDRGGAEDYWVVDPDGSNIHPVSKRAPWRYVSATPPRWTPDGRLVIGGWSGGIYSFERDTLLPLDLRGKSARGTIEMSPDGKTVYYASVEPGTVIEWSRLYSLDLLTGARHDLTRTPNQTFAPTLSRDGKLLAYVELHDGAGRLMLRDLEQRTVRAIATDFMDIEPNLSRGSSYGSATGFGFTPDGKSVVGTSGGKIWRYDLESGKRSEIPFSVDVEQPLAAPLRFDYPTHADDSILTARYIRFPSLSPDGTQLVFESMERIWVAALADGVAHPLTAYGHDESFVDHHPVWSPDGRYVAYATWSPLSGGHLWRMPADAACLREGRCRAERLTQVPALYAELAYAPDGTTLYAVRGDWHVSQAGILSGLFTFSGGLGAGLDLISIPAAGGPVRTITTFQDGGNGVMHVWGAPMFTREPGVAYLHDPTESSLLRVDLTTGAKTKVSDVGAIGVGSITLSPDGAFALHVNGPAYQGGSDETAYLLTRPANGAWPAKMTAADTAGANPVKRTITQLGGDFARWSADGRTFFLTLGRSVFLYDRDAFLARGATYEPKRIDIKVEVPRDRPRGVLVFKNARIITMKGREVIEHGDLVIRNNRIASVGPTGSVDIPAGAKVVDAAGQTIIPGFIDLHAHWNTSLQGIYDPQPFDFLAYFGYGVTTMRDPQLLSNDRMGYLDLLATDRIVGPRLYSTGVRPSLWDAKSARLFARRYSEFYGFETYKMAFTGTRRAFQEIMDVFREYRLMPTQETGNGLVVAIDGAAGLEHAVTLPSPIYGDAARLFAETGTVHDPTMVVQMTVNDNGDPYWFEQYDAHEDVRLRRFLPHDFIDVRLHDPHGGVVKGGRRFAGEGPAHWYRKYGEDYARIVAAGGKMAMGSHGDVPGIEAQWEVWSLAAGGMPAIDVLRSATLSGAEGIGRAKELGSIEVGKLADLQVLSKNPLESIRNTIAIRYLMKNGRLFDAATLDEVYPRERKLPQMWWWSDISQTVR